MDVGDLLHEISRRGIVLAVAGDRLTWTSPPHALTPELIDCLRRYKPEILASLAGNPSRLSRSMISTGIADSSTRTGHNPLIQQQLTSEEKRDSPVSPVSPVPGMGIHMREDFFEGRDRGGELSDNYLYAIEYPSPNERDNRDNATQVIALKHINYIPVDRDYRANNRDSGHRTGILPEAKADPSVWPERWREALDERSAIIEVNAGHRRAESDRRAMLDVAACMRAEGANPTLPHALAAMVEAEGWEDFDLDVFDRRFTLAPFPTIASLHQTTGRKESE